MLGKPEEKKPRGRHRHRWDDNIKMELWKEGLKTMNWIDLAQDGDSWRALNAVLNLQVRNCQFLKRTLLHAGS
jgi:hypothetical protein